MANGATAQERVYIGTVGVLDGARIVTIPFTGTELNALNDLQDISPTGALAGTVRVINPNGDPYTGPINNTVVRRAGSSPNGSNYLALGLNGQYQVRALAVEFANLVDAFGRPVTLVDGQEYEFVYWIRPAEIVNSAGQSFFYDYSPLEFSLVAGTGDVGAAPGWSPDQWTEASVRFTYHADGPQFANWLFIDENGGTSLSQFGGTGGTQPFILQSSRGIGLLDYGPIFRLDTSAVAEVYPRTLLDVLSLSTLRQRVGNRHWAQVEAAPRPQQEPIFVFCKDPVQNFRCEVTPAQAEVYADEQTADGVTSQRAHGLWIRAEGMKHRYKPVAGTLMADYETRLSRVQIGYDRLLNESDDGGRLIAGVYLEHVSAQTDVNVLTQQNQIDTEAFSLGTSLTWYGASGFYLDGQAYVARIESDLATPAIGTFVEDHKVTGYALSLEVGKKIELSEHWSIIPQAQLKFAKVDAEPFDGDAGTRIAFATESLQFRLGVEVQNEVTWLAEDGTVSRRSVDVGVHVIKELKPETVVDLSGTPLRSKGEDLAAEITLGGTYSWKDDRNAIYTQVAASTGLDNFGDSHRLRGTIGFRRQWE